MLRPGTAREESNATPETSVTRQPYGRLLWSGEFSGDTDMDDYVPLQRSLAERMAAGLSGALAKRS